MNLKNFLELDRILQLPFGLLCIMKKFSVSIRISRKYFRDSIMEAVSKSFPKKKKLSSKKISKAQESLDVR